MRIAQTQRIEARGSSPGHQGSEATAIIIVGHPPSEEQHLDQIVTGKVQYWTNEDDEAEFTGCLMRALNYSAAQEDTEFRLRFLARGEVLLKEGDRGDFVYFVKKGRLKAYKLLSSGEEIVLGEIDFGEFVGEMAFINGEPRSANVSALSDCELIEVPIGLFEKVLFKRPSWSKALMLTLSRRIKAANETKSFP
ncbi:MAG: Crp/Fnr family transcriptional regulator [Calothrix sp. SM1_5_4]|nr:Crp/Fnr family transcriptional regulator [Calothrix sp. SM1_5_4]